ncbi:MAG: hypothetical protein ACLFPS_02625 [Clostridia bacterium]
MENPIDDIKISIASSINKFLQINFIHKTDLSYNYKRNCFQTAILFNKKEDVRISYIKKLKSFHSNDFKLLTSNNFINIKIYPKIITNFLSKFLQYITLTKRSLTPIDYFIYYKTKESLSNIKSKAFINAQENLLDFYGYSVNKFFEEKPFYKKPLSIEFKLKEFHFSYGINNLLESPLLYKKFSAKYLNLLTLSKSSNSFFYDKKMQKKLNTKNPLYVTAYVIARLNHLSFDKNTVNRAISHDKIASIGLMLAEILDNKKIALSIAPLMEVLMIACKDVYKNGFYSFNSNDLCYHINIIDFLTNISQTTFFYY